MNYIIGIDIGTTSTKAVLYNEKGRVIESTHVGYPLYQETEDMAEQDVEEVFEAVIHTLKHIIRQSKIEVSKISGVSFSAAMHSLILVDEKVKPLTRLITWADNRAAKYSERLKENKQGKKLYEKTGTPIHPMTPLSKLIWLRNEEAEIFKQASYFIGIKEYIFYRLFGELKIDQSIASATGLYNIFTHTWEPEALKLAGITVDQLSEIVSTSYQFCDLNQSYADMIGLPKETIFIIGASDGVLSNLGVNAMEKDVLAVTIGTSAAVRTVIKEPIIDTKKRLFCYVLDEEYYVLGGPVNNGGIILEWIRDQLFTSEKETAKQLGIDSYDLLTQIAERIPAGSDGLLFLPYLGGERAPIWDANARGTYFGLNHHHTRAHMLRSVLEGIIFNLYLVLIALEEVIPSVKSIQATGGFARSELWCQMLADIFEKKVNIPKSFESSCLGAAILGLRSLKIIDDLKEVEKMIGVTHDYLPQKDTFNAYQSLLPIFMRLTHQLQEEYREIAEYQRNSRNE